jgi:tripartite ATP-independent transporter DctP family solute receptor
VLFRSGADALAAEGSGDNLVMKLGHTLSPDSHYQLTALEFAKAVKQRTNGKIDILVFPQAQLGGEVQMTQALRTGTQDFMIGAQAVVENTVKEWQVLSVPYLFDTIDDANNALQSPVGRKFLDMLQDHNMVGLTWLSALERDVFTAKKPVSSLEDLKGLKLRVMQSPGYIDGYRALGANPTPLAYNQLYLALQQGVVDGADTSPDQFVQDKFTEVAKHFYLTRTHYVCVVLAIGRASWNKLTPDLQKAIREAAAEATRYDIKEYKKKYEESLALMKAKGIDVREIDIRPWAKATQNARDDMLAKIPNGPALYKEIIAAKVPEQAKQKTRN